MIKERKRVKYTPAGILNPQKTNVYMHLYENFKRDHEKYKNTNDISLKVYIERTLETGVEEAGIRGTKTGLISHNAFANKIRKYNGEKLTKAESLSEEHPITFRSIARYLLNLKNVPSAEYFFRFWLDNLITVYVTHEENIRLKKYQDNFDIRKDDWRDIYRKAGIKLIKNPDLRNTEVKRQLGLI